MSLVLVEIRAQERDRLLVIFRLEYPHIILRYRVSRRIRSELSYSELAPRVEGIARTIAWEESAES